MARGLNVEAVEAWKQGIFVDKDWGSSGVPKVLRVHPAKPDVLETSSLRVVGQTPSRLEGTHDYARDDLSDAGFGPTCGMV